MEYNKWLYYTVWIIVSLSSYISVSLHIAYQCTHLINNVMGILTPWL